VVAAIRKNSAKSEDKERLYCKEAIKKNPFIYREVC